MTPDVVAHATAPSASVRTSVDTPASAAICASIGAVEADSAAPSCARAGAGTVTSDGLVTPGTVCAGTRAAPEGTATATNTPITPGMTCLSNGRLPNNKNFKG